MGSQQRYRDEYGLTTAARTEADERKRQAAFQRSVERDNQARVILVGIGVVVVMFAAAVWLNFVALPEWLR